MADWTAGDGGSDHARKAVQHAGQPDPGAGIHIKPSEQGSLHSALGVPQSQNIPVSQLQSKPGDSPTLSKKKNFARNARKFNH